MGRDGKRGSRVLRFAVTGALLVGPGVSACDDDPGERPTINEPAPNEPVQPAIHEPPPTVNNPPEPRPEPEAEAEPSTDDPPPDTPPPEE